MPRKSKDAKDYDALKKMGFGFRSPSGEFSNQPDSGSTIGGVRGAQENGITGNIAQEDSLTDKLEGLSVDETGGVSEWTVKHGRKEENQIERRDSGESAGGK